MTEANLSTEALSSEARKKNVAPHGSPPTSPTRKRGARRDREFRRYAEAVAGLQASVEGGVAMSSVDGSLTAFAQLISLRLDARRAMISLFDREKQYVIAEATRTLSLQQDAVHAPCDGLWLGASVWDRIPDDFFRQTLKAHKTITKDGTAGKRYFEANDLSKDARYANHRFVVNEPFARSFAGVPLLTPSGYAIGTVSFFDDKPRECPLTDEEVTFMQDIASTTMAHIEKNRLIVNHTRSVRMIHGLSRFIEGKATADGQSDSSFRNAEDLQEHQNVQTSQLGASRRTHAMNAASNAERVDAYRHAQPPLSLSRPRATSASSMEDHNQFRSEKGQSKRGSVLESHPEEVPPEVCMPQGLRAPSGGSEGASVQPHTLLGNPTSDDLQEDLLSKDVRHSFERAAAIINTAMNLSGTLFLDASVSEFGRLRGVNESSSSPESDLYRSEANSVKSDESDFHNRTNKSGSSFQSSAKRKPDEAKPVDRRGPAEEETPKACRTLASAYNMPPTASGKAEVIHSPIPERYLKSLLRRFPYGKQWNFDPNGNTSSDEFSDSSAATDTTSKDDVKQASAPSRRNRPRRETDGQILLKLFPGARSLALMPMYDGVRERFFAGAFVWSYDPLRVLTVQDDLNYLGAFCDVIMAEVGRLDAQAESLTKQTFISSMSHELRTPLHGILGGIECLQDKNNAAVNQDMLHMIESSGRSLLEIVDHLLEHAHATGPSERNGSLKSVKSGNKVTRNRDGSVPRTMKYNTDSSHQPPCDLALLTEEVLNTALWTTPKSSPFSEDERQNISPKDEPIAESIRVILDIDETALGEFRVNSGAWRRIIQNLASNSLKYTDAGYFSVSLSASPSANDIGSTNSSITTMVELVFLDSGRGMSQQFLKYGLWQAFSQEDSGSQGTGLGLSLVHGIVKEMGGTIDVQSRKAVGTAIRVRIPLRRRLRKGSTTPDDGRSAILERLKSCTCVILGFDEDGSSNERAMKANAVLTKSIGNACTNYGMRVVQEAESHESNEEQSSLQADIVIVSEEKALQLNQPGPRNEMEKSVSKKPTIILCHSVASSRLMPDIENAIAVAQPLGPRKLLRALTSCLEKAQPDSTRMTVNTLGKSSEENDQSPLVLTSRPESTPRSSYFGTLSHQSNKSQSAALSGLATLLVDDNDINLMLLRAYMNKNKHAFTCASNGLEAVNAYKDCFTKPGLVSPSVILMDLTMPVMSGLEATRQIRAFERSKAIRPRSMIIALTAMSSSEARQEAFGSGVDHFMTKPVKLSALGKILGKHVEERNAADRSPE